MSSEAIISASGLGKCYQIYDTPAERLKQMVYPRLARLVGRQTRPRFDEFWALRDINFDIPRGETVGILGRNGSGKTTLLQVICGTLPLSEGECHVNGRVAALLELGAGFKPEFTGRENVLINSAIAGIPEDQALSRMQEVIDFAELGNVIDRPVKTYSSGMYVRLAFSAAIHVDPDILVVDEALAVGDARFQAKCFRRINEMKERGMTILFVSHATEQIAMHCSRALLLDGGRLIDDGQPRQLINRYLDLLFGKSNEQRSQADSEIASATKQARYNSDKERAIADDTPAVKAFIEQPAETSGFENRTTYHDGEYRWGDGCAEILDYLLVAGDRIDPVNLSSDEDVHLYVKVRFHKAVDTPVFGFNIKTLEGVLLTGCNSRDFGLGWGARYRRAEPGEVVVCRFVFRPRFESSNYLISLGIASDNGGELSPMDRRYDSILVQVESRDPFHGLVSVGARCEFVGHRQELVGS